MSGETILILENDPKYTEIYTDILTGEGYTVHNARRALDAFNLIKEYDIDLIITDQKIGRSHTGDVLAKILAVRPHQRILYVTSEPSTRDLAKMFRIGVNDYLLKPFEKTQFLQKLRRVFQLSPKPLDPLFMESDELVLHFNLMQRCRELLGITDIQELANRLLEVVCDYTDVPYAVLWTQTDDENGFKKLGKIINRVLGENKERAGEATRDAEELPDKLTIQDLQIHDISGLMPDTESLQGGFYLQIGESSNIYGVIYVPEKSDKSPYTELDWAILRLITEYTLASLKNISNSRKAPDKAVAEPTISTETDLFNQIIDTEISKAHRYLRKLSLLSIRISNYSLISRQMDAESRTRCLSEFEAWIRATTRETDTFTRENPGNYYILLPETDFFGSLMLIRRCDNLMFQEFNIECFEKYGAQIEVSYGAATYPQDGKTSADILGKAKKRRELWENSMFIKHGLDTVEFWESLKRIIGAPGDYQVPQNKLFRIINRAGVDTMIGFKSIFDTQWFMNIMFVLTDEIFMRNLETRGFLYICDSDMEPVVTMFSRFHNILNLNTKIYLLGESFPDFEISAPNFTLIQVKETEIKTYKFLFYLSEDFAYGYMARMAKDGQWPGYHTNDIFLVEQLIFKLQSLYNLQNEFN